MTPPEIVFTEKPRGYTVNGLRVPSVTQALGVLDKPALAPWAAKLTVEGFARLMIEHRLPAVPKDPERLAEKLARENIEVANTERDTLVEALARSLKRKLKRRGVDHHSFTDDSIVRGKATHKALEDWINHRRIPVLADYPVPHRGYIQGLTRFLYDHQPEFLESERPIGSAIHGFAGRRDTVCVIEDEKGRGLLDAKTSKAVYPTTHFPQLIAYDMGGVECGEPPTDWQGILRVGDDGTYEIRRSVAVPDDFLAVLKCYNQQQSLLGRAKEAEEN